jgi:glucose-6-phosphate 1-dehydrogenase
MNTTRSDTLVFFGATGDLAYKKIFPSLEAMAKHGRLDVPVIGVAKAGWTLEQLRVRPRDSVEKHGGFDQVAFERVSSLLQYVDGDYGDPATFDAQRGEFGSAGRPAHYLAIPLALFGSVVQQLAGRAGDRKLRGLCRVQCARETHHGRKAVSLRQRPRQTVSQAEPPKRLTPSCR